MSVFYVNVESGDIKIEKSKASIQNLTETRYNSERDIAYTGLEKTADGNIALQEVRSAENLTCNDSTHYSASVSSHPDVTLNYIDLDFDHNKNHSKKKNNKLKDVQFKDKTLNIFTDNNVNVETKMNCNLTESGMDTKYACIDFNKTSALKQISRSNT